MKDTVGKSARTAAAATSRTSRVAATGRFVTKNEARAAAKAKVTVDKKLGKTTPDWIKDLAAN